MAQINFGGVKENVVTREEFPLAKALEVLKNETIAVIGYGVQGPGQALNLKDNGFNVIVGQRRGSKTWDKAVADGWIPGETLFDIEEAARRGTIIQYLLSDAGQIAVWPTIQKHLTPGKALYFSHGFGITYKDRTGIIPPGRCRCHPDRSERLGYFIAENVLTGTGLKFQLCHLPGCHRQSLGPGYRFRNRSMLGLSVRDHLSAGSIFRPDRRTGYSDGSDPGHFCSPVRHFTRTRPHPFGSLQRNRRGTDPKSDAFNCRKRYGLDVCQLLDDSTTGSTRLVEEIPGCRQTGIRRIVRPGILWQRSPTFDRFQRRPDYREKLEKELQTMRESEMWQAGAVVRKLRPENN